MSIDNGTAPCLRLHVDIVNPRDGGAMMTRTFLSTLRQEIYGPAAGPRRQGRAAARPVPPLVRPRPALDIRLMPIRADMWRRFVACSCALAVGFMVVEVVLWLIG